MIIFMISETIFRLKPKNRSSSLQDVNQKEMKLLTRINKRLNDLKNRVNSSSDDEEDS